MKKNYKSEILLYFYSKYFCLLYLLFLLIFIEFNLFEIFLSILFTSFEIYFIFKFKKISISTDPFIYSLYLTLSIPDEYLKYSLPFTLILTLLVFRAYIFKTTIYKYLNNLNINLENKNFLNYNKYSKNFTIVKKELVFMYDINYKIKFIFNNNKFIDNKKIIEYSKNYNKKIEDICINDFSLIEIIGY